MDSHTHKINRDLIIGWLIIVGVLFVSYCGEVLKGTRTVPYLIVFMLATAVPAFFCLYLYRKKPDMKELRYYIVVGYFIMYLFSMLTGSTSMVFSYILPMLSLLVLYHQPKLILYTGAASMVVNIVSIIGKFYSGAMTLETSRDAEIQVALLVLCFGGSYMATKLYDEITDENTSYIRIVDEKNSQIQKMTLQTITTIANTIDAKDEYTQGHSQRVSEYSAVIARELGLSNKEIQDIRSIALLHDIGKIGVPDAVLNKPGKLTREEFQLMKQHTVIGSEILKDIGMLPGIDIGAKYHHERYDGNGYPEGLKGEEIPFIARIIAVADAYDAMTSNRVYRNHLADQDVLREMKQGIGKQFDPGAARVMVSLMENGQLENISPDYGKNEDIENMSKILGRVIEKREEQLVEAPQIDELTGVYNRKYGETLVREELEQNGGCMMVFDLDFFQSVNDRSGVAAGDIFLKIVARCISRICEEQIVFRLEGDSFVMFSKDVKSTAEATELVKYFQDQIQGHVDKNEELRDLSVSIGIALGESGTGAYSRMLRMADKALYMAKQYGGGRYCFYHQADKKKQEVNLSVADLQRLVLHIEDLEQGGNNSTSYNYYEEFDRIYKRIREESDLKPQRMQIILFTVQAYDERRAPMEDKRFGMDYLEKAIFRHIQEKDTSIRYSSSQWVILLPEQEKEDAQQTAEQIMKDFFRMYAKREVNVYYAVAEVPVTAILHQEQ